MTSQYNERLQKAAALKYSPDSSGAPVVVASGKGYIARKIIDVALKNNIPVYSDDSLATLLSQLDAGSEIPPELYRAVVDLYVYFLDFAAEEDSENDGSLTSDG